MNDLFVIRLQEGPDPVIECRGELDICAIPDLEAALAQAICRGRKTVGVDLAGVHYIDSACINALLRAKDALAERGGRLALVSASPVARRAFQLLSLSYQFMLFC